jgi:hypothetical protein
MIQCGIAAPKLSTIWKIAVLLVALLALTFGREILNLMRLTGVSPSAREEDAP